MSSRRVTPARILGLTPEVLEQWAREHGWVDDGVMTFWCGQVGDYVDERVLGFPHTEHRVALPGSIEDGRYLRRIAETVQALAAHAGLEPCELLEELEHRMDAAAETGPWEVVATYEGATLTASLGGGLCGRRHTGQAAPAALPRVLRSRADGRVPVRQARMLVAR